MESKVESPANFAVTVKKDLPHTGPDTAPTLSFGLFPSATRWILRFCPAAGRDQSGINHPPDIACRHAVCHIAPTLHSRRSRLPGIPRQLPPSSPSAFQRSRLVVFIIRSVFLRGRPSSGSVSTSPLSPLPGLDRTTSKTNYTPDNLPRAKTTCADQGC